MPRQILFIQGAGEGTHDKWDNKLVASLEHELGEQYTVRYPRMPDEAEPLYPSWKAALLRELDDLDDGAILIGHSIGGTFLIHLIAEQAAKTKPGAVLLIAPPFLGEGGWPAEGTDPRTDLANGLPSDLPVFLYRGTADDTVPSEHIALYARAIPHAKTRALADRNHQLNDDLSDIARDIRDGL